jgi:predicted ribosomally synthesized peptide with SipW-like signal peptide
MMKLKTLATGLFAIIAIAVAVAAGAGATTASFSDQVTSGGNTFKAGTLQLNLNPAVASCAPPARTYGGVTGNAGVDGNTGCSVTNGATYSPATTAMKPGDSSTATYGVTNIGTLSGTLSVGATSWSVTTAGKGTCAVSAANFTISSSYSATSVAPAATANVPVTGAAPLSSADGCQGATITASVPFLMNGAATTGFSDRLTSGGNVFTMTTLPAPVLGATLDTDTTKVDLTWTGSYGSFPGTTFTGARYAGGVCAGSPTALNSGNAISSGYVDAPASAGQYSYMVTAHFATNWVAVSNCATATTSVPGTTTSLAGATLPASHAPFATKLYTLGTGVKLNASSPWSISVTVSAPSNWQGTPVQVDIWFLASGSCGSVPATSANNYIAGNNPALTGNTVPTLAGPLGTYPIPVTANPAFTQTNTSGTVCMLFTNVYDNNGSSHDITYTGTVTGPWQ